MTKWTMRAGVVGLLMCVATVTTVHGAGFIKFDGVDGEASDKNHVGWSDLVGFKQAHAKPGGTMSGSRRRGDVILTDIICTKELDKASPKIAEAVCTGRVFPKVEIEMTSSYTDVGRVAYYEFELINCWVTSYSISGSGQAEDVPTETMAIAFEEIKVTYYQRNTTGEVVSTTSYSWSVGSEEVAAETLELGSRTPLPSGDAMRIAQITQALSGSDMRALP